MHPRTAIGPLLACALAALATAPAHADVTLDIASIIANEDDSGWRLRVELEGSSEVTSATLTPPGGPAFALPCGSFDEGTECEFESAEAASLAALLAAYPSGEYLLSLNGGERTAGLPFDPIAPDGLVTVTSPADGAVVGDDTPTIAWTHDCTNCVALGFDLVEITGPLDVGLERIVIPPVSPGALPYSQLESYRGPKPSFLPEGLYALTASTAVAEFTTEQLVPGNEAFQYTQAALRDVRSSFTVPEPRALASGLAALAALACAAVRRKDQPPAATSASSISIQPSRA